MAKNLFTREFYREVYKQIDQRLNDDYNPTAEYCDENVYVCIEDDDRFTEADDVIEVEADVCTYNEFQDESFDHAFGTWHDPCPYWKYCGIEGVEDIRVIVNGKEVQGYNRDDFYRAFQDAEHHGFKAGDTVRFRKGGIAETTGTLLYYDELNGSYRVKAGDKEIDVNYIKPAESNEG